jgi:glutamate-1-semialdehyde 2,1-aminomutase
MFTAFFTETPVTDCQTAKTADTNRFAKFFRALLDDGVYIPPSQFEALFLSAAHTEADITITCGSIDRAFDVLK